MNLSDYHLLMMSRSRYHSSCRIWPILALARSQKPLKWAILGRAVRWGGGGVWGNVPFLNAMDCVGHPCDDE